jgi:hypothetical protein
MRASIVPATLLALAFTSCAHEPRAGVAAAPPPMQNISDPSLRPAISVVDALHLDLVQRTCAMYVAVRSAAFAAPLAFGNEVEDSMVHWNLCPGGTMVACAVVPSADGDSTITGIPWPYHQQVGL